MRNLPASMLFVLAMSSPLSHAADLDTAQSYQYLRALRAEAQALSTPAQAPAADLQLALRKYQQALDYLATPPVAERANGYTPMRAERINLLLPMAETYAKLGMKEQALTALEQATAFAWLPGVAAALEAPGYASLRDEPRFQAVQRTMRTPLRVMGTDGIAGPYKPVLSTEEKVAGLSLFWSEARRNFVHFDHVPELDWNRVYMDYLSRVIAAPTTRDYYVVMSQLAPLLQDGHTNIYAPQALHKELYARPPLTTALVEDKVLVTRLGDPALAAQVQAGDEIVAIDGQPVKAYAEQHVAPFVSASTPQDRALRMYSYQLLLGDESKPVSLRVRAASGAERTMVLKRGGRSEGPKPFEFKMLDGGVAYLAIGNFESDQGVKMLELALPEILKAKALIVDVRRNGGGSSGHGNAVLSYLSREPFAGSASYVRAEDVLMRAQGAGPHILWTQIASGSDKYSARHEQIYTGPVAVLTSAQTFSAAEDFAVAFRGMKRGIIVGEPTGGSSGQPLFLDLPGGGKARICVKRDTYPDGTPFVGVGVLPDVAAHPTVASVRAGTDPVLEAALAALAKGQR